MKKHRYLLLTVFVFSSFGRFGLATDRTQQSAPSKVSAQDAPRITEAFDLWRSLGEKIWPSWTAVSMPLLYITPDYEYAIGFSKTMAGFQPLEQSSFANTVQVRKRGP